MALCTQADVEQKLQYLINGGTPHATVTALIAHAQARMEAECGRTLEDAARSQTFDGGRLALFLKYWPVTAVATVTEDGTSLTVDDDFMWYPNGTVLRVSNGYPIAWRTGKRQAIDVTYNGGFVSPDHDAELQDLKNICSEVVARAFRLGAANAAIPAGSAGAVQSVTLDGRGTVTYATGGGTATFSGGLTQFVYLLDDERNQLARYKGLLVG